MTATISTQAVYDAITTHLYKGISVPNTAGVPLSYTGKAMIEEIAGAYSVKGVEWAQPNYKGTPSGCSKKYTGYSGVESQYQDFIKKDLTNALQ